MTFIKLSPEEAASEAALEYPFTFVTEGDTVEVFASETLTGIVEALIEGYDELPEPIDGYDAHLDARIGMLAGLGQGLQEAAVASLDQAQLEALSEEELTALFHGKDAETLEFESWESDVPLLLLATNYAPYTSIVPPTGDSIIWLNPHNERLFLDSVARLGLGTLWVNADAQLKEVESF